MPELPFRESDIIPRFRTTQEIFLRFSGDGNEVQNFNTASTIRALELTELLGWEVMLDASMAFAQKPDAGPFEHTLFAHAFLMFGRLVEYATLVDEKVPVNAVTANVVEAEVIGVDETAARQYKTFKFEIPLLALNAVTPIERKVG